MNLRKIIFWLHLTAGVLAGAVILVMSMTGVLLAFERQIVAFAERDIRTVAPPASDTPRLSLDTMVARAREMVSEGAPSSITLSAHPTVATMVNFGVSRRYSSTHIPARYEATGPRQRAIFSAW
jgi:uncharacterized iron-regulated membrane protein